MPSFLSPIALAGLIFSVLTPIPWPAEVNSGAVQPLESVEDGALVEQVEPENSGSISIQLMESGAAGQVIVWELLPTSVDVVSYLVRTFQDGSLVDEVWTELNTASVTFPDPSSAWLIRVVAHDVAGRTIGQGELQIGRPDNFPLSENPGENSKQASDPNGTTSPLPSDQHNPLADDADAAAPREGPTQPKSPPFQSYILWGQGASITQAPWQVALLASGGSSDFASQFCGGSIIDPSWVLTAAHCLEAAGTDLQPGDLEVLYGTASLSTAGQSSRRTPIAEIYRHPSWDDVDTGFDIALLELATPLDLDGVNSGVISLARQTPRAKTSGLVTGWGASNCDLNFDSFGAYCGGFHYPTQLQQSRVSVLSEQLCEFYWPTATDQGFCVDPPPRKLGFPCFGDSGGPFAGTLSRQPVLYGVTSFGASSCFDAPAVYQDVAKVRDWIEEVSGLEAGISQRPLSVTGPRRDSVAGSKVRLGTRGGSGRGSVTFELVDPEGADSACSIAVVRNRWILTSTEMTSCVVRASKSADGAYRSVESDSFSINLTRPAKQRPLRIVNSVAERVGEVGAPLTIVTSGGSVVGGDVTVSVVGDSPCGVDDQQRVVADSPTRCRVTATLAGSGIYGDVTSRPVWVSFRGEQPSLSIEGGVSPQYVPASSSLRLRTTGGAGSGRVTYALSSEASYPGCRLKGNRLSISRTETPAEWPVECQVVATKAANGLFLGASSVEAAFLFEPVEQKPLRIRGPRNNTVFEGAVASLRVAGGSGKGAVSVVAAEPECTVTPVRRGWTIDRESLGECAISVTKEAQGIYLEAIEQTTIYFVPR